MIFDAVYVSKVAAAAFATTDPIGNVPVFLALTEGWSHSKRKRAAWTATTGAAIGCLVGVVAGSAILAFFGIALAEFRMVGGLLLLLTALQMVRGGASGVRNRVQRSVNEMDAATPSDIGIYPLTFPLLVGPGTLSVLIVYGAEARARGLFIELTGGLTLVIVSIALLLLCATMIGRHISETATSVVGRLTGMLLAGQAVGMMVKSLRELFPLLTRG